MTKKYLKVMHYYIIKYDLTDIGTFCVSDTPELLTQLISIIRSCSEEQASQTKLRSDERIGYPLRYQELLDLYQFCKDKEYDYATESDDLPYLTYKQAAEIFRSAACLRDESNFIHIAYFERDE